MKLSGLIDKAADWLANQKKAVTARTDFPYLLSGEHNVVIPLRPALMAHIVAEATSEGKASLFVTEDYAGSDELRRAKLTLERQGWSVTVEVVSPSKVRMAYGHSADTRRNVDEEKVSANTSLFDNFLEKAIKSRADEIHYCVRQKHCGILHLIDGLIYAVDSIPAQQGIDLMANAFANLADDNSYEKDKTSFAAEMEDQSCTIYRKIGNEAYKLRYASVPDASGGFDVTLRILRQGSKGKPPTLEELNFLPSFIHAIRHAASRPHGGIITCGPVGGGKTTLLYSLLYKEPEERNQYVITVEDPPEYEQYGITRVPVENIGYEGLLKKLLRMGVHVAFIGEVRDNLMGNIFFGLSEVGKKTMTTLHVNQANRAIYRLTGETIGLPRQVLCDTSMIAAIVHTCLVPKLCEKCCQHATPENLGARLTQHVRRLHMQFETMKVRNPEGCEHCKAGRRGRLPVVEIIIPDEKYMQLMREGKDEDAKQYWLSSCTTHVTEEDVTGKPSIANALYWVSKGLLDIRDLEMKIDFLETFEPRVSKPSTKEPTLQVV